MIRALVAFDFDGVLFNNLKERYMVALRAFNALEGEELKDTKKLYDAYISWSNDVKSAEDLISFFRFYEKNSRAVKKNEVTKALKLSDQDETESFAEQFYIQREKLKEEIGMEKWYKLHKPYKKALTAFKQLLEDTRFEVIMATAKDKISVKELFSAYDIELSEKRYYTRSFTTDKQKQLQKASTDFNIFLQKFIFIDDLPKQVEHVAELGVNAVLAGWGYAGKDEQKALEKKGFTILEEKDIFPFCEEFIRKK